jgi:hypothetical protein
MGRRFASLFAALGAGAGSIATVVWIHVLIRDGYRPEIVDILGLTLCATLGCLAIALLRLKGKRSA